MDELSVLAKSGGSDLFPAGTYKVSDGTLAHPVSGFLVNTAAVITSMRHRLHTSVNKVSTITITGTSGTAYISLGELKLLVTFSGDLDTTAANFVTAYAAALLPRGIVVTSGTATIIFTSTKYLFATPTIANATGNLAGSVVTTGADGLVTYAPVLLGDSLIALTSGNFEYPVEEIVIASGTLILNYIK